MHCCRRTELLLAKEVHDQTVSAGTSRSAGAVDVVLFILWRIEVNHCLDAGDVYAAGCNVGRKQRHDFPLRPSLERALPSVL